MAAPGYCKPIDELCELTLIPNPSALYELAHLSVRDVDFTFTHNQGIGAGDILIYCGFGPLPVENREAVTTPSLPDRRDGWEKTATSGTEPQNLEAGQLRRRNTGDPAPLDRCVWLGEHSGLTKGTVQSLPFFFIAYPTEAEPCPADFLHIPPFHLPRTASRIFTSISRVDHNSVIKQLSGTHCLRNNW
jgi:hypothetical protein